AWRDNSRIQKAENNNPAMRTGEKGEAVHLLQAALILNGFDVPHHGVGANGERNDNFGNETAAAVRAAETGFGLSIHDGGVAGKEVIGALDNASTRFYTDHAGHVGAPLAVVSAPRANLKVSRAITGASALLGVLQSDASAPAVTPAD